MLFNKCKKYNHRDLDNPNVIGVDIILEGAHITGESSVRVDGIYRRPKIECSLVLGGTGIIEGNVNAWYALNAGTVKGSIKCKDEIHLAQSTNVSGNIESPSIIVDRGAKLNGKCKVVSKLTTIDTEFAMESKL